MPGTTSRLRVRVAPGGRRAAVVGRHCDAWKIRVAAAPERGRANDEVVTLLASALAIPRADVRLVTGLSSRDKIIEIRGLDLDEVDRRLQLVAERPTGAVA